jgi:hypothetical protein
MAMVATKTATTPARTMPSPRLETTLATSSRQ